MPGLCAGAVALVQSTLLPSQLEKLEQKLTGKILCISARLLACLGKRAACHDPAGVRDYKEPMGRVAGAGGGPSLQRRQYKIGMGERKRGEETRTKHTKPLSTSARSSSILNSVRPLSDSPSLIPIPCCSFSLSLI
jgi:hypothetical protein